VKQALLYKALHLAPSWSREYYCTNKYTFVVDNKTYTVYVSGTVFQWRHICLFI